MVARISGLALAALLAFAAVQGGIAADVTCDASCLRNGGICEQVGSATVCVHAAGRQSRRLLQDATALAATDPTATDDALTETIDLGATAVDTVDDDVAATTDTAVTDATATDAAAAAADAAALDAAVLAADDAATEIAAAGLEPVSDETPEELASSDNAIAQSVTPAATVSATEDAANNPVAADAATTETTDATATAEGDGATEDIVLPTTDLLEPAGDVAADDAATEVAVAAAAEGGAAEELDVSAIEPVEDETDADTGAYDPATVAANEAAVEAAAGGVEEGSQATGFAAFWNSRVRTLSGGAIAGIVIGVLAGVALIVGGSVWACRRRRRSRFNQFATGSAVDGYSKYADDPNAVVVNTFVPDAQQRV